MKLSTRTWIAVALGPPALALLAWSPNDILSWIPLWLSLTIADPRPLRGPRWIESTKDASGVALLLAFLLLAAIFTFCLLPASFWTSLERGIPKWLYGFNLPFPEISPAWGVALAAALWLFIMWRRVRVNILQDAGTAT